MTRAVRKKAATNVVAIDLAADAGGGMEGTDAESFAIPFLTVLQKGSPQVDEDEGAFVKGAKQSMFINSVTEELFDGKKGLEFIPCAYQRRFIRWGAKKQGGGFKGEYTPDQVEKMRENGEIKEVNGKLLIPTEQGVLDVDISDMVKDTRNHFGLVKGKSGWSQVLLSLSSTQIKKSRALMSMLNQIKVGDITPPTYYNIVHVTTVPESNDQGSWHGVKFHLMGDVGKDPALYNEAKEFSQAISTKKVNVNYQSSEPEADDRF